MATLMHFLLWNNKWAIINWNKYPDKYLGTLVEIIKDSKILLLTCTPINCCYQNFSIGKYKNKNIISGHIAVKKMGIFSTFSANAFSAIWSWKLDHDLCIIQFHVCIKFSSSNQALSILGKVCHTLNCLRVHGKVGEIFSNLENIWLSKHAISDIQKIPT